MLELFAHPDTWLALASLTALEIVLGIDNVVFIAILTARVPMHQQKLAYRLGLGGALLTRIALLFSISWVMRLQDPLFAVLGEDFSGRDLILLIGGVFLIGKSAHEIYDKVESVEHGDGATARSSSLAGTVAQIMVLDLVFSLDSVITAVGMVEPEGLPIMVAAIIVAVLVMLLFAKPVGDFVNRNPSMKILALSFLLLIGVLLTAEGFDQHVNKGYIYFAMGFALIVELVNMRFRSKRRRTASPAAQG